MISTDTISSPPLAEAFSINRFTSTSSIHRKETSPMSQLKLFIFPFFDTLILFFFPRRSMRPEDFNSQIERMMMVGASSSPSLLCYIPSSLIAWISTERFRTMLSCWHYWDQRLNYHIVLFKPFLAYLRSSLSLFEKKVPWTQISIFQLGIIYWVALGDAQKWRSLNRRNHRDNLPHNHATPSTLKSHGLNERASILRKRRLTRLKVNKSRYVIASSINHKFPPLRMTQ